MSLANGFYFRGFEYEVFSSRLDDSLGRLQDLSRTEQVRLAQYFLFVGFGVYELIRLGDSFSRLRKCT